MASTPPLFPNRRFPPSPSPLFLFPNSQIPSRPPVMMHRLLLSFPTAAPPPPPSPSPPFSNSQTPPGPPTMVHQLLSSPIAVAPSTCHPHSLILLSYLIDNRCPHPTHHIYMSPSHSSPTPNPHLYPSSSPSATSHFLLLSFPYVVADSSSLLFPNCHLHSRPSSPTIEINGIGMTYHPQLSSPAGHWRSSTWCLHLFRIMISVIGPSSFINAHICAIANNESCQVVAV